ncbi:MAG TPA: alpha/beta hydrolase [Xanthomonadaceae bacterium]|jgi:predicted alpha/beta-fold hydrolase|nr:alpha/beta hydrolase [Xanthomonadaceae bacterium]
MLTAADYRPPAWLRSGHLQSVLSAAPPRRVAGERALAALSPRTTEWLLPAGPATLQAFHLQSAAVPARAAALLLHGWEGSHRSSYVRHTAAALLRAGFDVVLLNFRDHGDTHHLNPEPFHSCRLDEVVQAAKAAQAQRPDLPWFAAGFSLGGNFALRLAHAAPAAGLRLAHVAAICPVVHGEAGLRALEGGLPLYHWYFMRKWRRSLQAKRRHFPDRHRFAPGDLDRDMRGLTRYLVERYTEFPSLEAYLDGYAIAGDRLAGLAVPASILTAADDPVIPVADFHALRLPAHVRLEIAAHGGHCGFLLDAHLHGFAEVWIRSRFEAVLGDGAAARVA